MVWLYDWINTFSSFLYERKTFCRGWYNFTIAEYFLNTHNQVSLHASGEMVTERRILLWGWLHSDGLQEHLRSLHLMVCATFVLFVNEFLERKKSNVCSHFNFIHRKKRRIWRNMTSCPSYNFSTWQLPILVCSADNYNCDTHRWFNLELSFSFNLCYSVWWI